MEILIIILIGSLIILTLWNILTIRSYKNKMTSESQLNDGKYFELKYKMEFMIAVFSIIIAFVGFLGYRSFDKIKNEITDNIQKDIAPITFDLKKAKIDVTRIDSTLKQSSSIYTNLYSNLSRLENKISSRSNDFDNLNEKIKNISDRNILKRNFYIIDNLKFNWKESKDWLKDMTYYYKDLTTNIGDKLPVFTKPPIIIITPTSQTDIIIYQVTNEYVKFLPGATYDDEADVLTWLMVIIENN